MFSEVLFNSIFNNQHLDDNKLLTHSQSHKKYKTKQLDVHFVVLFFNFLGGDLMCPG